MKVLPEISLRVHSMLQGSRANGPGTRNVLWFQGCSRRCPGCFNPQTHPFDGGRLLGVTAVARELLSKPCDGVSISGGEPLEQPSALLALLNELRLHRRDLSILLFSGYGIGQIRSIPGGDDILALTDILVAGAYNQSLRLGRGLRGSSNQQIHFLSTRHKPGELEDVPSMEVIIGRDGTITFTGIKGGPA